VPEFREFDACHIWSITTELAVGRLKPDKRTVSGFVEESHPDHVSNRIALITSGDGQTLSFLRLH
jgi:hypothetical protein